MSHVLFPVILSGGAGTRLWPLSRELHPKQFIPLVEEHTLLQATARRLAPLDEARAPIVVCNEAHRFIVAEQLAAVDVTPSAVLLEPAGRNTAPAIAAAALEALALDNDGEDPILLVLPADHVIRDEGRFGGAVRAAVREAAAGHLVTFGVAPRPCGDRIRIHKGRRPHRRQRGRPQGGTVRREAECRGGCPLP